MLHASWLPTAHTSFRRDQVCLSFAILPWVIPIPLAKVSRKASAGPSSFVGTGGEGIPNGCHIIARTGWTVNELWQGIQANPPEGTYDLVTLLIGVNDQYRGHPSAGYREDFRFMLSIAIEYAGGNPDRVIVLSIPDWGVTPFAYGRNTQNDCRRDRRVQCHQPPGDSKKPVSITWISPPSPGQSPQTPTWSQSTACTPLERCTADGWSRSCPSQGKSSNNPSPTHPLVHLPTCLTVYVYTSLLLTSYP